MPQSTRGGSRVEDEKNALELESTEGMGLDPNSCPVLDKEKKEEINTDISSIKHENDAEVNDVTENKDKMNNNDDNPINNEMIECDDEHSKSNNVLFENKNYEKTVDKSDIISPYSTYTEEVEGKNIEVMKNEKTSSLDSNSDINNSKSTEKENSTCTEAEQNKDTNKRRIIYPRDYSSTSDENKEKNNITEGVIGPYGVLRALNREEEAFTPRYAMNDPDYLSLESYFIPMIPLYTFNSKDNKNSVEKDMEEMKGKNMLLVVPVINSKGVISYKLLKEGRQRDAVIDALQGLSLALQRNWNNNEDNSNNNNNGSLIPQTMSQNGIITDMNFETFQQQRSLDENFNGDNSGINKVRRNRKYTKTVQNYRGSSQLTKYNENNENTIMNSRNYSSANIENIYQNNAMIGKEYEGVYNGIVPGSKRIPTDVNNDYTNNSNNERRNGNSENLSLNIDRPYISTDENGVRVVGKLGPDQKNLEKNDTVNNNNNSNNNNSNTVSLSTAVSSSVTQAPSKPTKFSQFAISVLMNYFAIDNKPSPQKLTIIAEQTGLTRHQVRVWFQNKRARKDKQRRNNFQGSYITGVMQYSNVGNNITPNQAEKFNSLTNQEYNRQQTTNNGSRGPNNVTNDKINNNNNPMTKTTNDEQQQKSTKTDQMSQDLSHASNSSVVGVDSQNISSNGFAVSLNPQHYNVSPAAGESLSNQDQMMNNNNNSSRQQYSSNRIKNVMISNNSNNNQHPAMMTQQAQVSKSYTFQIQPQQAMSQSQLQHKNIAQYNSKVGISPSQVSPSVQPINNALLAISNTLPNGNSNKPVVIGTISPTNIPGKPTQVTSSILETGTTSQYHLSTNNSPTLPIQTKIPSLFTQIQASDSQKTPSSFNPINSKSFANTNTEVERGSESSTINAQDALNNFVVDNAVGINKSGNYDKEVDKTCADKETLRNENPKTENSFNE